ncbi:MAG TPA: alpha/beta hydrolase, partial [Streptosporangiaceae bacterium]
MLLFEDLDHVILAGHSSPGAVVTAVADRVPERIGRVVSLDAFVPANGQRLLDIIPPGRRSAMELLAQQEGGGWLLPRFAPAPWEQFIPAAWQVTNQADLQWMLTRLRPAPLGHFT